MKTEKMEKMEKIIAILEKIIVTILNQALIIYARIHQPIPCVDAEFR